MPDWQIEELPVERIDVNPYQARQDFDYQALSELKESIKEHGVLQPIVVRRVGERYQLIAGERRLRASRMAGRMSIPATIRDSDPQDSAVLCLMENLQRKDLNPLEEAQGYQKLLEQHGLTQEAVAKTLGKGRSTITNHLRLLELPRTVQEAIRSGDLSFGHAKVLLALKEEPGKAEALAKDIAQQGLSVRETEARIAQGVSLPTTVSSTPGTRPPPTFEKKLRSLVKRFYGKNGSIIETEDGWRIRIQREDAS